VRVVPNNCQKSRSWLHFVADSIGLASVNLTQFAPKAVVLSETTRNNGHWAVQCQSRSPILVPIETRMRLPIVKFILVNTTALLYGLEACPLRVSDCYSLDFVVNRFSMKLFKTNSMEIVSYWLSNNISVPIIYSTQVRLRSQKFIAKYRLSENLYCK